MPQASLKDLSAQWLSGPVFRLQEAVIIGRSSSCQLCYPKDLPVVSRQHARIFPVVQGWAIEDLGSRNGTFVNHQRVQAPVLLQPNSRIMLGWEGPELLFVIETDNRLDVASLHPVAQTSPLANTVLLPLFFVHRDSWEG